MFIKPDSVIGTAKTKTSYSDTVVRIIICLSCIKAHNSKPTFLGSPLNVSWSNINVIEHKKKRTRISTFALSLHPFLLLSAAQDAMNKQSRKYYLHSPESKREGWSASMCLPQSCQLWLVPIWQIQFSIFWKLADQKRNKTNKTHQILLHFAGRKKKSIHDRERDNVENKMGGFGGKWLQCLVAQWSGKEFHFSLLFSFSSWTKHTSNIPSSVQSLHLGNVPVYEIKSYGE